MMQPGVYRYIGRIVSPLAIIGLRAWTFISHQERARIVVDNEDGQILLVKGTISDQRWSLPGGGIEKGELAVEAVVRELLEETGITVDRSRVAARAVFQKGEKDTPYTAHIFSVTISRDQLPTKAVNPIEIGEIAWFGIDVLPDDLSPMTRNALKTLTKS